MRIDHNIPALQAWMSVKNTNAEMQTSIQRLSTGHRINSAADDAAGYAIVEKMMGQVSGLNTAIQNSQNAISAIQTATGALNQTQSILQRMRELGVEASNDTNTTADRQQIQKEVNQLIGQIDQIRNTTQFNTQVLLNGNLNNVAASGSATLVNPSNTITSVTLPGGASVNTNTTITINTIETGTASAPNAVQVYVNGTLQSAGTAASGGGVSISGNTLSIHLANVSGGGAGTGDLNVTLNVQSGATVYTAASTGSYQVADSGALRLDATTSQNNDMVFQVGANQSQTIQLGVNDMGAQALGLESTAGTSGSSTDLGNGYFSTIDVTTKEGAQASITLIDNAIQVVSTESAKLGAIQNRLTHITQNLQTASTNLTSAQSTIKDVDMAKEMMTFSKQRILLQSSMAMLAQANTNPQQVLRLFR